MPVLPTLLANAAVLTAATGFIYTMALLGFALVSVASRKPARRRDARATLAILMRRSPRA
ncbi:hypothetical protein ACQEU3_23625 [Spirillospora sp. CA-253888]